MAKALDIEASTRLDNWYNESNDATEVLIANALMNLNDNNPSNKMVHDYFAFGDGGDFFQPSTPKEEFNPEDPMGHVPDNPELDIEESDLSGVVTGKEAVTHVYDNYKDPGYLDRVKGQKIQMPDGSIRIYSQNGYSYNTQGESWMGLTEGTNIVTTHNKLSGQPMPEPSTQYSGISFYDAFPALLMASGNPAGVTAGKGLTALQIGSELTGWGPQSQFNPNEAVNAGTSSTSGSYGTISEPSGSYGPISGNSGNNPLMQTINQTNSKPNKSKTSVSVGGLSKQNKSGYTYDIPGEPKSTDKNSYKVNKPVGNWYRNGNELIPQNDPFFYDGYRGKLSSEWSFKLDNAGINTNVFKDKYESHLINNNNPMSPEDFAKGLIK